MEKYCPANCKYHPAKAVILWDRTHVCIGKEGEKYGLKEEHSRGRHVLKRKGCPFAAPRPTEKKEG